MANITVSVVYALPTKQIEREVSVPQGSTVLDAIDASNVKQLYPELKDQALTVGIFSQKVDLAHTVSAGDRIEIYRPLQIDPKTARIKRAKK